MQSSGVGHSALACPCNLRHDKNTRIPASAVAPVYNVLESSVEDECSLCKSEDLTLAKFSIQPCSAHVPEGRQSKLGANMTAACRNDTALVFVEL